MFSPFEKLAGPCPRSVWSWVHYEESLLSRDIFRSRCGPLRTKGPPSSLLQPAWPPLRKNGSPKWNSFPQPRTCRSEFVKYSLIAFLHSVSDGKGGAQGERAPLMDSIDWIDFMKKRKLHSFLFI